MSTPDVDGNRGSLSESERLQFLSALTEVLARAESLGDGCRNAIRVACEWLHAEQGAIDFVSAGAPGEPDVIVPGYAWPERADMRVDLNQPPFSAQAVRNPDLTWRYGTPTAQAPNHADISHAHRVRPDSRSTPLAARGNHRPRRASVPATAASRHSHGTHGSLSRSPPTARRIIALQVHNPIGRSHLERSPGHVIPAPHTRRANSRSPRVPTRSGPMRPSN